MKSILITTSSFHAGGFKEDMQLHRNPYGRKLTEEELIGFFQEFDPVGMIAGVEPITARALDAAPSLKVISRCGVGIDSIDMEAVHARNIAIFVTPEAPTISVSELTMTLILNLLKRIHSLDSTMRAGGWKGTPGALLMGKRIGIVGCGRIGTRVAKLAKAFDAIPVGYDPYMKHHSEMELISLETLLSISDIVTLHVPLLPETRYIVGENQLALMKPAALLINAARGALVDEKALFCALQRGKLGGAALDCFEQEPYNGELIKLDNVILSPHMGSSAVEARAMMEQEAVRNLVDNI